MSGLSLPDDFTGRDPAPQGHGGGVGGAQAIRCPACRREHLYEPPSLPCPCGASLKVPLLRGGVPVQVRFRSWEDSWLSMRCPHCGRSDQWPQPEFTCNCGATVRLPVDRATRLPGAAGTGPQGTRPQAARPYSPPVPAPPAMPQVPPQGHWQQRAPFHPQPVHTSQDAVFTAARYLEWLGFDDLELTEAQERDGVTLLGRRMVAQVDVWTEPADVKCVECLWLQTLHAEEMAAAMFTMAGYSHQATVRGEQLLVALFSLDPAGVPQPANGAAESLMETGWTS
ncbi:hypothetical protein GCM10010495_33320 [Kitasatospora herbaricolor]|uniref:hypothetical protein n=1 Tax=Kitasatospora herbaricolor TaxID=68217 RepID=UPI0019CD7770|nr:hypothetical protein [Kitasatospora herbaricolor]MDQ0307602.1 hypothetical protein [Kitasatospora herbaricolor]GGV16370.1 hypothetical protein GCM10010495_33320 [Kitasatospora herbaricolor]